MNKSLSQANTQIASTSEELSQAKTTIKQVLKEKDQEVAKITKDKEDSLTQLQK